MDMRLIVPTVRSTAEKSQPMALRALVLADSTITVQGVTVYTKPLGSTVSFAPTKGVRLAPARDVFSVSLPETITAADFEWYAEVETGAGGTPGAVFPAGAPAVTQSVVVD